ncbi:TetR/AcrR family transcriptional regulator [Paracoccaceae bacterium GXU_MW_L88]
MSEPNSKRPRRGEAREKLLETAMTVIRRGGFSAMTVEQLCQAAGVTKGGFFHHFDGKEALGVAAAKYWGETTSALFAEADYHKPKRAKDRLFAYLDLRELLVSEDFAEFTCVAGTMVQEQYDSSPAIREACGDAILGHAQSLEMDIAAALAGAGRDPSEAASLARFTQSALQGGFIIAKAANDPEPAREAIRHLRAYFQSLFGRKPDAPSPPSIRYP